jgi:hypothetical protein
MASYGKSQARGKYQTTINQIQHRGCGGHEYKKTTIDKTEKKKVFSTANNDMQLCLTRNS